MPRPIPKTLARKGLVRTTDNLQPGQSLVIPSGLLFAFFGKEARAIFDRQRGEQSCPGGEK